MSTWVLMLRKLLLVPLCCALLFTSLDASAEGPMPFPQRHVLGGKIKTTEFQSIVQRICDPTTQMIPDTELKISNYFIRLTLRKYAVAEDGQINPDTHLGGKPYVFFTVPQAAYGRSLYGIYSDIGYDAEAIIAERSERTVALVIRYRDDIKLSERIDGNLDKESYRSFVYVPTWKNAFALFARLAGETTPADSDPLKYLSFNDDGDRDLARYFPPGRRARVATLPYQLLRAAGGPDWQYRSLLETKLGLNSHFRGVGITENTLSPADSRKGLPEFVGPNLRLRELEEYAVIDLGRLEFVEVHD
jgi:hypothetical protein